MARTQDGEYYYDAGTINEQLDDYEIYEQGGRLYLNKEGADPDAAISFDGFGHILGGSRTAPTSDEIDQGEGMLYIDGADQLVLAYNTDGSTVVENVLDGDLSA